MDVINLVKQQASLLRDLPIGNMEWAVMFKNLKRLAAIALLENFVPRKQGESVWDTNKFAVRALLEGAKSPVLVQMLHSYTTWKISTLSNPSIIDETAKGLSLPQPEFIKQLEAFEFSTGSLLYCCLVNTESHQSIANEKFIDYLVYVYDSVKKHPALFTNFTLKDRTQPVMGFMYLLLILKEDEDLPNEKEFWKNITDKKLISKMIQFFVDHSSLLPTHIVPFLYEALALVFGHDLFDYDEHLGATSGIAATAEPVLKEFKASLTDFISKNTSKRALFQPLTKNLAKLK